MTHREALEILAQHRGQRIVIPTMASIAIWPLLSDTPLDFAYMPSAMGQGPTLGLGLALAQPERGVIVLNGDGSMLMNLGSLVTLANHPANIYVVVMDNGIYEVTGGQPTAGTGHTDFAAMAQAAGARDNARENPNARPRIPGDMVMISGEVSSGITGLVYIVDTTNGYLSAMTYDDTRGELSAMPKIDLAKCFEGGARGARNPNRPAGAGR